MRIEKIREPEDDNDAYETIMTDARSALFYKKGEFALEIMRGWSPDCKSLARYLVGIHLNSHEMDGHLIEGLINRVEQAMPKIIEDMLSRHDHSELIQSIDWLKIEKQLPNDLDSSETLSSMKSKEPDYKKREVMDRILFLLDCGIQAVKIVLRCPDKFNSGLDEGLYRKVILMNLVIKKPYGVQPECFYLMEYNDLIPRCRELLERKYGLKVKELGNTNIW